MLRREETSVGAMTWPSFGWPLVLVLMSVLFVLYDSYKFFGAP